MLLRYGLNSLYGALLNPACRFYDPRIGQSVTLTGRCITKHMGSSINEMIEGTYNHVGKSVIYGDSVDKDSIIDTDKGKMTIEDLFLTNNQKWINNDSEYSVSDIKVRTYNPETNQSYYDDINYVYRHKVFKERWKITDDTGNFVIVTNDHSVMVERDGNIIEVKPSDIKNTDLLIVDK